MKIIGKLENITTEEIGINSNFNYKPEKTKLEYEVFGEGMHGTLTLHVVGKIDISNQISMEVNNIQ
jgi:hypothetical protein